MSLCYFDSLSISLVSGTRDTPGSSCILFARILELAFSPRSSGAFYMENNIRNQDVGAKMLCVTGCHCF